jgi:hypothetical protein
MTSRSFNPSTDLPPISFDQRHCELAATPKDAGLPWTPHVGCFVWDRDRFVQVSSPFPNRIYFILNIEHFLHLLGTAGEVKRQLIWLPTWHQARFCSQLGVTDDKIHARRMNEGVRKVEDEISELYGLLLNALRQGA